MSVFPVVPATLLLYTGSAVLAFVLAAAITPLVGRLAERLGMMDIPGGRRLHPRPMARPGGLAIAIAFGLTILALWLIDRNAGRPLLIPEEVS
jgi:UDP-GlcNAc:undecaprenyl-phosphate GlcNAc-1-phosphate transferase